MHDDLPAVEVLENTLARTESARALPYLARLNVVALQLDAGLPLKGRRASLPRLRRNWALGAFAIHDSARTFDGVRGRRSGDRGRHCKKTVTIA